MIDKPAPDDYQHVAGITPASKFGSGFAQQTDGCEVDKGISPELAKAILDRLCRHVSLRQWNAAVAEHPDRDGLLRPLGS